MIATVMRMGWDDKCEVGQPGSFTSGKACSLSAVAYMCEDVVGQSNTDITTTCGVACGGSVQPMSVLVIKAGTVSLQRQRKWQHKVGVH